MTTGMNGTGRKTTLTTLLVLFVLTTLAVPAAAGATQIELTPTLGYRTGGFECSGDDIATLANLDLLVFPPPPCALIGAEAQDDVSIGAILGIEIAPGLQVEILANRFESELERRLGGIVFFDFAPLPDAEMTVTHLQAGVAKTWGSGMVRPFAGVAIGASRVDADDPTFFTDFREDAFSASAGFGVKSYFGDRVGLRVEGRGYWVDLPSEVGGDVTQEELSVGLILRW